MMCLASRSSHPDYGNVPFAMSTTEGDDTKEVSLSDITGSTMTFYKGTEIVRYGDDRE